MCLAVVQHLQHDALRVVAVLEWIISKTGALASDLPEDPRAEGYVSRGMLERY